MRQRILIIEDDPDIGGLLALHAGECAAEVRLVSDGARGLLVAQHGPWDVIVLDWLLPQLDGVAVCRRLRASDYRFPIMFVSARTSEADRVSGLDTGADDYVIKPFAVAEFKARLRSQLRRATTLRGAPLVAPSAQPLRVGPFCLDPRARTTAAHDRFLELTAREFDLLWHFAVHPGQVFSRGQLLAAVWGGGFDGFEHTVNSHINRLRAKIEPDPARPRFLRTVWGVGYRLDPDAGG